LITVDTDGDNGRSGSLLETTKDARYVERFQDLCESYGLRPTYLTNREMAECPVFKGFAGWVLARGAGEIGMHLNGWGTPPIAHITDDGRRCRLYLSEYPERVLREEIRTLTGVLEDTFGVKMVSHRAGRWDIDERYASLLLEAGYFVDCSVEPLWYWRGNGNGPRRGGPDDRTYPAEAYWVDLQDISRAGDSPLLEVPMTILPNRRTAFRSLSDTLRRLPGPLQALTEPVWRVCDWVTPPGRWLHPNGSNGVELLEIVEQALAAGLSYAEITLHTSELKLGGSRTSRSVAEIERLFDGLTVLFSAIRGRFRGVTLAEFHAEILSRKTKPSESPLEKK
jgi:hypothetical protein